MAMNTNSNAPNAAQGIAGTLPRCEHALELLHTHRGNPSVEVDRVLADDPQSVFGHCLRAALIVLADDAAARSTLAASLAVIEAASTDMDEPARRHAAAARAWLEGNPGLAAERYGAIVTRQATRHSRARGRACARLPSRPAAHAAGSHRPGAARMGGHGARLRERSCDVRLRPRGERSVSSLRKGWRVEPSPSILGSRPPFTLSPM